ncbi:acetyltransferase, GNAT family [Aspergillus sclerotioniger CBS 115572]|uniref:Glucosamine 6-phosphate N-acetyltransferase n=1 Tax=Aspergillus sclerotioniger CBS 115572 TaxID=1450535 RepID=A0A317X9Q0_9EURO|nr:acetyltransferase, GNAT family [Aspergillus sclerotioniger CBS 115572]PWY95264.1 acetyltransferase, GNAT family [Aspergillus sclerotioniger CBS 115572]
MSPPAPTFTTTLIPPPGKSTPLNLPIFPTPTTPTSSGVPLTDALIIRSLVFINEQNCTPEGEIDNDDARSWQWVIYHEPQPSATTPVSPTESKIPVAVIRLVPPPHEPHEALTHPESAGSLPKWDTEHEPYVKLTRVAVLKEWRGYGLGRTLVEEALEWARGHAEEIERAYAEVAGEKEKEWKGLVLVHAQTQVERMYARMGFETDEGLGRWDEEGIEHVGMWRRVQLS